MTIEAIQNQLDDIQTDLQVLASVAALGDKIESEELSSLAVEIQEIILTLGSSV